MLYYLLDYDGKSTPLLVTMAEGYGIGNWPKITKMREGMMGENNDILPGIPGIPPPGGWPQGVTGFSWWRVDERKAVEAACYVHWADRSPRGILDILYCADRLHLERYGRTVYGESGYLAMRSGIVGEYIYNHIQEMVLREPDLKHLSESDIECLEDAIANHEYDHGIEADCFDHISLEAVVKSLPDWEDLWDYLTNRDAD